MKQSFTQLIAQAVQARRVLFSTLAVVAVLAATVYVFAAVGVTVSGGGTFPVSADLAANAASPGYTSVGDILITEVNTDDFTSSGNIVLTAPTGWRFNNAGINAVGALYLDNGNTNISVNGTSVSADRSTITISLSVSNTNKRDRLTISGVQVQALNGINIPATGNISVSAANGAVVSGLPANVPTVLSQTFGALRSIAFTQQPSTVNVGATMSTAPRVTAKDQFGNTVTTASGSASLVLSGTPSSALITSGATANFASGVATFSNLSIDEGGNFTLLATYSGNNSIQATSSPFVVNNLVPTVSSALPCITVGSGINQITVTGTGFVRGSKVRINGADRTTTFINSTSLSATLQPSDVGTAQTLSVTVFNPTPAGGSSNAVNFVIHPVIAAGAISGVNEVCEGAQGVTYSVAAGAASYNWTVGPGATIESGASTNAITVRFGNTASSVNISVEAVNACGVAGSPSNLPVTVTPFPTNISAGPAGGVQFCTGTSATLGSGDPAVPGYTYQWSPVTGLSNPNDPNPTITLTNSGTTAEFYTYTLTVTNGAAACEVSDQVQVTVYPELIIAADDVEPVCIGNQIELRVSGAAGYTYSWTGPNGFTSSEQFPVIPNASEANEGTYTVVVTNQQGCVATDDVEVTIAPLPTANAGADQRLCTQGASTAFTVTGTPSAGAVGTWSVVSGTASIASPTSLSTQVNVSSANATLRFTAETPEGCQAFDDVVLTVDPLPTVTLAPLTSVCESVAPFALSGGFPAGGTYSGPGVTNGIFDPVAAGGDGTYTITYTYTNGNGCTNTASRSIVVKPQPVVSVTPDSEICYGASMTLTASGATTYRWEPAAGLSATTGATVTANPLTTTTYTVYGTTNGCESVAQTVTVTVNPLPDVTITPTGPTEFCDGNYVDLVTQAVTGYTYQWYDANTGNPVGSASTYRAEDTGSYYVTITTDKGCTLTSATISIIVAKLPNEATITAGTTTFCEGGSVQISANSAPAGQTYEYVWESSSNNVDFTPITGVPVTSNAYVANASGYYRVKVSDVTEGNVSDCFKTSQSIQVTVLPQPTANITSSAETQCQVASGRNVFAVTGTYSGGTGTWSATNGFTFNGSTESTVNGVTTSTATFLAPASFTGTASVTLLTTNANASCNPARESVTLRVQPLIAGNTITGTATYCQNASATALTSGALSGGAGGYAYTWEQSADNSTWVDAAGTNNQANYTPSTANVGTMYYRRTVNSGTCSSISNAFAVTVNPNPAVNAVADKTYCNGESGAAIVFGSPVNGSTYNWTSSANVGFGTSGTGNIPAYTASNTGTAPVTATVTVRATANGCQGPAQTFTVTVNPTPSLSSTLSPGAVCSGAAFSYTATSATAGTTYTWARLANPAINGGAAGSGTTAAINETLTSTSTTPVQVTYRYTLTANGCPNTQDVVVTVNPSPAVNAIANRTHCNGEPGAAVAFGSPVSGVTYNWTSSANVGFGASGTGNIPAYTASNTGTAPVTATVTVRATANGCQGPAQTFTVTVNPSPAVNAIANRTHCNGEAGAAITFGSPVSGATYSWTSSANVGFGTSGSGNISAYTASNAGTSAVTATVTVRATANGCQGPARTFTVTVSPNQPVSFTGTIASTDIFYTGQAPVTLAAAPTGGTFSGPGVTGTTFNPCTAGAGTHTITYTRTTGSCSSTVSKTVTVRQSQYRVVVISNPKPFCQGDNTDHEAWVVRDAQSIIYPYLTNANGEPVDGSGRLIGTTELPVANPAYPFPAGTPDVIKQNAYRYFNPIITLGANGERLTSGFSYQWTKNQANSIGKDEPIFSNAGLSSLDYYAVRVTSTTSACGPNLSSALSTRTYTSQLYNYDMTLAASKNPICPGDPVTFTATLNSQFPFWNSINLVLQWQVNGVTQYTSSYGTGNAAALQWTTTGPAGGFKQGDVVSIRFNSDVDGGSLPGGSKCASGNNTALVTMNVNVVPAITGTTVNATCAGSTATLSVNAIGTGLTYQWYKRASSAPSSNGSPLSNGGRISGATSANLSIANTSAADAGLYYVEVSGACPPLARSQNLELNITPVPTAYNVTGGGEFCTGGSGVPVGLANSQVGVNYQLFRSVNGGTPTSVGSVTPGTGSSLTFGNQLVAGTYTIVGTSVANTTTAACSQSMTGSATVIVNPLPTVSVNSPTTCENTPVTVTAVPSGGTGPYTYTWTVPNGVTNPGNVPSFQTTVAGTYTVRVTDSKSCASSAAATSTVTVNPRPTVTVNSPTVCSGTVATVVASASGGTGPYTYTWTVPNGVTNPGNVPSFQTTVAGTYTVRVTDSKSCASSAVATSRVTVNPLVTSRGSLYIENEQGEITPSNPIMPGKWLKITALSDIMDDGVAASHEWSLGNDAGSEWNVVKTGRDNFLIIDPVEPGEFNVRAVITPNNNGTICYDVLTLISSEPLVPLPVEIIYFNAAKQGNNVLLEWATASEKNNTGFEVQVSQDGFNFRKLDFVPTKNGNTVLKQVYQYTDKENGKRGTRYYRLKQIDEDGQFEYFTTKAVTFTEVASKVKAFPNPFSANLTLDIAAENSGEVQISMWNAVGRKMMERTVEVEEGFNTINLDMDGNLTHGVYFLRVYLDGKMHQVKLLKE